TTDEQHRLRVHSPSLTSCAPVLDDLLAELRERHVGELVARGQRGGPARVSLHARDVDDAVAVVLELELVLVAHDRLVLLPDEQPERLAIALDVERDRLLARGDLGEEAVDGRVPALGRATLPADDPIAALQAGARPA